MVIERASGGASLIDVLDRVLDKGIVIDAWVRVSLVGIDLITPSRGGRAVARAGQTLMPSVHAALAPGSPGANRVSAPARLRAASAFIPW
jgi:Gas vesicle protein